jgi:phage terminase large subunit-like protein
MTGKTKAKPKPKNQTAKTAAARSSTSSPRAASAEAKERLKEFAEFCETLLITDAGTPLKLERWQREVLLDYFDGARELITLLGKGNGKTTLFAALAVHHLIIKRDARCYIAAASRDQAALMYDFARGFVSRSPALEDAIIVRPGYRELRLKGGLGFVKVIASDDATADGVGPTLVMVDELHRHKTAALYAVFRDGLSKRSGQMVTISTAGSSTRSPLGEMRQKAHELRDKRQRGFHLRAASDDGTFIFHEWAVPEGENTNDIRVVKRANPSSFVTEAELRRRRKSPSMQEGDWLRYACNQWHVSQDAWLEPGKWPSLAEPGLTIPDRAPVWVGVDIGLKYDTSAVAVVGLARPDGRHPVLGRVFEPPGDGQDLDLFAVEAHIRDLANQYQVLGVVYDRWNFSRSAMELSDGGLLCLEFPMTNERTVPACARLLEAVNRRELVHDGDPILQAHVEAGVIRQTERGWRLSKGKAAQEGGKIDLLIALLLAFTQAGGEAPTVAVDWI